MQKQLMLVYILVYRPVFFLFMMLPPFMLLWLLITGYLKGMRHRYLYSEWAGLKPELGVAKQKVI